MNSRRHWLACLNKKGTNVYEDTKTRFIWCDEKDL